MNNTNDETKFNKGSWLAVGLSALILFLCLLQIGYRMSLPSDGSSVHFTDLDQLNWVYDANLVGALSDVQPEDILLAVDDLSLQGLATTEHVEAPPNWQVGNTVTMKFERGDEQLSISVPVVNWTVGALWRFNVHDLEQFAEVLGAFLFLAVGWFTFLRQPRIPSTRALLLLSTAIGAATISGFLPDGLSVQFNQLAFVATWFFSYAIFGVLMAPSLLAFSLLFPRPKVIIQRRPWLALLPYGLGLLLFIVLSSDAPVETGWLTTLSMIIASILSLVHSAFTQRDAVSQAQLRWAFGGFVAGLGLLLFNFPIAFGWTQPTPCWWRCLGRLPV